MPHDYKHARRQVLMGGSLSNLGVAGGDEYFSVYGNHNINAVALASQLLIQYAGVIFGMTSFLTVPPGGVASRTLTLYLNGVPTALTVTHVGASDYETDDVNIVAVQRGDRVNWHSDGGVGVPAGGRAKVSAYMVQV